MPQPFSTASYDAANQLTNWNGTTFTYDANGNLTNDGASTYTWNARNEMTGVGSAAFAYDAYGRRRQKTIAGTATQFMYDGANAVQEQQAGVVTANLLTGGVDQVFQRTDGNGTRSLAGGPLGSTWFETDNAGNPTASYTYAPFGDTTVSGTTANPTRYTGREDDGTGLYNHDFFGQNRRTLSRSDAFGLRNRTHLNTAGNTISVCLARCVANSYGCPVVLASANLLALCNR